MRQHIKEAISTHPKMEVSILLENYAIPHLLTFLMEFLKVSLFHEQIVEQWCH